MIKEMAERINDAIFDGRIPLNRVRYRLTSGGTKTEGSIKREENWEDTYTYTIRLRKMLIDEAGWEYLAKALEHEYLHIWLSELGLEWDDISKDNNIHFAYWAGRFGIPSNGVLFSNEPSPFESYGM